MVKRVQILIFDDDGSVAVNLEWSTGTMSHMSGTMQEEKAPQQPETPKCAVSTLKNFQQLKQKIELEITSVVALGTIRITAYRSENRAVLTWLTGEDDRTTVIAVLNTLADNSGMPYSPSPPTPPKHFIVPSDGCPTMRTKLR